MMRPGYQPANRRNVAGELLNSIYRKEFSKAAGKLQGLCCTIQMDGWTSPRHDPTVAISVQVTNACFLLSVIDTNGQPQTAEWLAEQLLEAITLVERELGCRVIAVATDSTAENFDSCV